VDILRELADKYSIQLIGISGGCFQNRLLTERIVKYLAGSDLTLLTHGSVSPNDGGLAIGQVVVALKRMNCRTEE
jgi:hydrogenase maturation protein HypF